MENEKEAVTRILLDYYRALSELEVKSQVSCKSVEALEASFCI